MIQIEHISNTKVKEDVFTSIKDVITSDINKDDVMIKISFGSLELGLDEIHERKFYTVGDFIKWCETED